MVLKDKAYRVLYIVIGSESDIKDAIIYSKLTNVREISPGTSSSLAKKLLINWRYRKYLLIKFSHKDPTSVSIVKALRKELKATYNNPVRFITLTTYKFNQQEQEEQS